MEKKKWDNRRDEERRQGYQEARRIAAKRQEKGFQRVIFEAGR